MNDNNNNNINRRVISNNQQYRIRPTNQIRDTISVQSHNNNNGRSSRSRLNLNLLFNSNPSNQPHLVRQSMVPQNRQISHHSTHTNRLQ